MGRTRIGAAQRCLLRVPLLFANPARAPRAWLAEQYALARRPGFLDTSLAALRAQVGLTGQKQVLRQELDRLTVPVLLLWGGRDRVVPVSLARIAADRLLSPGRLQIIPAAGHLPHVERPTEFVSALTRFPRLDQSVAPAGRGGRQTGNADDELVEEYL